MNYWCDFENQERAFCDLDEDGNCAEVMRFLNETPDPDVPASLVIKVDPKDLRRQDREAGNLGTQRDGFISGA